MKEVDTVIAQLKEFLQELREHPTSSPRLENLLRDAIQELEDCRNRGRWQKAIKVAIYAISLIGNSLFD